VVVSHATARAAHPAAVRTLKDHRRSNLSAAENVIKAEAIDAMLDARVRIPQGVVYRTFVKETVILNLETGRYHGLNPTGGRMLATLEERGSVRDAAAALAKLYGRPLDEIQQDLCEFAESLVERGLLTVEHP
jgi:hypothetical protein